MLQFSYRKRSSAPTDYDVYEPQKWVGNILVSEPERKSFRSLIDLGLYDSVRELHPENRENNQDWYTWWDYRRGAWHKNWGLRIDHLLLSSQSKTSLKKVGVDKDFRGKEKPSDHAALWCELD